MRDHRANFIKNVVKMVHSKQYRFFSRVAGFSGGCMVIVLKGSF